MNDALREALEIGLDLARAHAADYQMVIGWYSRHAELDADVRKIEAAIAGLQEDEKEVHQLKMEIARLSAGWQKANYDLLNAQLSAPQDQPYNQFGTDY